MEDNPYRSPVEFDVPKPKATAPSMEQYHIIFIVFGVLNCIVLLMLFPPTVWNFTTLAHPPWPFFGALGFFLAAWGAKAKKMWLFYMGIAALAVDGALILAGGR